MLYDIDAVRKINLSEIERLGGEMAEDLQLFLNRATRYCVKYWWKKKHFKRFNKEIYLPIKGRNERDIVNFANNTRLLATVIRFNLIDEYIVGTTKQSVQDKCLKLIRSLCNAHAANVKDGWFITAIAATVGTAGWLMWDKLNDKDKLLLINMLEFEANRIVEQRIPFQHTRETNAVLPGKSRMASEFLNVINIAIAMMPDNINCLSWRIKHRELQAACYATESDGLNGWNVANNGLVMEGERVDVRSMSGIVYNFDAIAIARLADEELLPVLKNNALRIYDAFNNLYISRNGSSWRPLYSRGYNGCANAVLDLPKAARGPAARYANLYAIDVLAYANGCSDINAREWAEARMKRMLNMQSRHRNGMLHTAIFNKDHYRAFESSAAKMASISYLSLYLKAINML